MPTNPFVVEGPMLKEIAQSLLEMKKMARSFENSAEALIPLLKDGSPEIGLLTQCVERAREVDQATTMIYRSIAREAMTQ